MKKAIYKITNNINKKIYIGQSSEPEKRWQSHCFKYKQEISLINRAINKYGKENFTFEIIGWFEDYNEKEKFYISQYRSLVPYGYNIATSGEEPPHPKGEEHPMAKLTQEEADKIIAQILDWRIPEKTILSNNKITRDMFRHIKEGTAWRKDDLEYPLRPTEDTINNYRAKYIQWMCCSSNIPLNQLGKLVGWGRSSAKMINQGKNHFDERLIYPIRNNKEENYKILSKDTCTDYLHFGE